MGSLGTQTAKVEWPNEYTLQTNEPLGQDCITCVCLSISGRLDPGLLEQKHCELVKNWPVLGGDLVTSKFPYHMTTGSRVDFKHRTIDAKLRDATPIDFELAKTEREGNKPIIRPYRTGDGVLGVTDLFFDTLSTLNLVVGSLFAIRVTLLEDATIIAFKFSHFFVDGQGCYDIVHQYNDSLWGKELPKGILPPGIDKKLSEMITGEDTTPVDPPEAGGWEYIRNWCQVGLAGFARIIAQGIYQDYAAKFGLTEPGVEKHIYLPPRFISELQDSCQRELDDLANETGEQVRLSKIDVVNAWWTKRIYSSFRDSLFLSMGYAFNFSDRIQKDPSEKYFQGHYFGLYVPLGTVGEMKTQSLAQIALRIRKHVAVAKQPSVIRDNLEYLESIQGQKVIPLPKGGDSEGAPLFSSWNKFSFEKLDFSPALEAGSGTGKVLFNNSRIVLPLNIFWKPKLLFFNDLDGGIWCQSMQLPSHWKGFEDINEYERPTT
ncbi:hypothetical protein EYR41_002199 [Orbilia oligospora]|uniref:Uncharacterized protein n=1 Tax=Orbilia oligospora TaxID=2813651 RepID=A0A7C8PEC6_ORBOL|nr:hypothetical protein TWF751_004617 [Orbilia oligospora]TGJ75261.1 hypothetical protein EYR41_002199 [Orbilia oligospora]